MLIRSDVLLDDLPHNIPDGAGAAAAVRTKPLALVLYKMVKVC